MRDRGIPVLQDWEEVKLVVCGLIDIGIMVVTWKSGAPYGWVVFEGILSLFAAAGLAGD